MPKKKVASKKGKADDKILFAFLATFLSIAGFIIAVLIKKDDEYVMHYAKQSLLVFLVFIAAMIILIIPFIGWVLSPILYIIAVILWVISWIQALSGKIKEIPVLGQYGENIDI